MTFRNPQPDKDPAALVRIGVDLFDAAAFEPARDIFRLLVLEQPTNAAAWYWLGRSHQELGDEETARAVFDWAARSGRSPLFLALARGLGQRRETAS